MYLQEHFNINNEKRIDMRYKEIAIIGMSGKFASVDNIEEYRKLLKKEKSVIDFPPKERLELMGLSENDDYMKCGYIRDIALFDNDFFEVTKREAKLMSPEQRISLELVADAILDAGYSLNEFRGKNCGVYIADGESTYNDFVSKKSSASIIGSQSFMLSGRIGYHFGLEGDNIAINSGCSSALSTVHYACEKLTLGEVDTAIVGGIILYIDVPKAKENMYDILGIMSKDYTIKSFDEKANGTVCGEGGGFVLLKSLEQAEKDGDHIYGVLLCGAVNGDGARCTNVSMPSVEAQGDVVAKAWEGVDIDKLTEIEAHGVGAPVGDAVEAQAYIDAIKKNVTINKPVKLSTVKPNIGHLFSLSGISSLLKVLTGYKYNESYPITNLENLNPLINFEEAGIEPSRSVYYWDDNAVRMTGISSFGLSGCNTHIVVKNYQNQESENDVPLLLKISAKTKEAFEIMKKNIIEKIEMKDCNLADFIYTMNVGRDDYDYRGVVAVGSIPEFKNSLEMIKPSTIKEEKYKVIFAIKTESIENSDDIVNEKNICNDVKNKLSIYNLLQEIGIKNNTLLVDKIFKTGEKFEIGECSINEYEQIIKETEITSDYSAYYKQIQSKNKGKDKIILVDFTNVKAMSHFENDDMIDVYYVQEPSEVVRLIKFWYENIGNLEWDNMYKGCGYKRVSAPTYPFERKQYWIEIEKTVEKRVENVVIQNPQLQVNDQLPQNVSYVTQTVKLPEKKVFVMKSELIDGLDIKSYPYNNADFKNVYYPETAEIDMDYKLAMYRYVTGSGIIPDTILADKRARAVISYSQGKISKKKLEDSLKENVNKEYDKVISAIEEMGKEYALNVFDFGHDDTLASHNWNCNVRVVSLYKQNALEEYLSSPEFVYKVSMVQPQMYQNTGTAQSQTSGATPIQMTQNVENSSSAASSQSPSKASQEQTGKSQKVIDAENFLEKTWAKAFNLDGEIGHDEDFFALGGNSLIMQTMSDEINEYFNKKVDIFEIYDYETIEKFAVKILGD